MKNKIELRKTVLARLLAQEPSERIRKSTVLGQKLLVCDEFRHAKSILFFVSMPEEVQTHHLIDEALAMGKRVVVPRCDMKTKSLDLYEIRDRRELVPGILGILEPHPSVANQVQVDEIDLVLVPGVVFDKQGNRIGRGAGFYDRFLKSLKSTTAKIGLAYVLQVVPQVPVEAHDVKLDQIITEED